MSKLDRPLLPQARQFTALIVFRLCFDIQKRLSQEEGEGKIFQICLSCRDCHTSHSLAAGWCMAYKWRPQDALRLDVYMTLYIQATQVFFYDARCDINDMIAFPVFDEVQGGQCTHNVIGMDGSSIHNVLDGQDCTLTPQRFQYHSHPVRTV